MQMNTTTRKRLMVCPPAYSQCEERKRSHVAKASPKIINRASLPTSTRIFVGILWPPILSMFPFGHGNHGFNFIALFGLAFVGVANLGHGQHFRRTFADRDNWTGR